MRIRALVVDDEPLARQRIHLLAGEEPDLDIVGDCANGHEAIAAIPRDRPDLVFLDVQMPAMDGFQVLQAIPRESLPPVVIFATAYDQHAVRAFEAHALDYLLKPFKPDRFKAAVARAREHLANLQAGQVARGLLDLMAARQGGTGPAIAGPAAVANPPDSASPAGSGQYLTRLTVRTDDKVMVIRTVDIDSIESAGNYVAVHVGKDSHILRETLTSLEGQLDPERFLRISRSAIVNLDRVRELQPMFKGDHVIVLHNGKRLAMTRGIREVEHALRFS